MIKKIYHYFVSDSLYKNSIYLMTSTLVMAVLGFFFWMINARLFTTEQIGLATTLISAMTLITSFSLFGLDVGIIRYLPKSRRKSDKINTCFTIVILVAISISIIFVVGLKIFSPQLLFIRENLFYSLFFIISMMFITASSFIESVFIALREAKFVLMKNVIFSIFKPILPFLLVSFGVMGIFASWTTAVMIGFLVAFLILILKFDYRPELVMHQDIIKKIGRFSFGNYLAGFFGGLPVMVFPLMITNLISPETTAYYYMPMMIASLLFIIPVATTQSLFAEGSYSEKELKKHIKKAAGIILLILIPAIFVTLFFGKYILLAFGKDYSVEGFRFLQILALSGIFVSVNSVFQTVLKIEHKIKELVFISFISALSILGLGYLFISQSLIGVGLAWLIGQGAMNLFFLIVTRRGFKILLKNFRSTIIVY